MKEKFLLGTSLSPSKNQVKRIFGTLLLLWIAFAAWIPCSASEGEDENFVIASLLVASPGDVLYSCVGHACLRMQCPTHNLDYCFSYEGEPVEHQIGRFFAGKLKMGMYAIPTEEYLPIYANDKRGVKQYQLNLPLETKRRLWKILDDKVMEGANHPYDYFKRGCAQTIIQFVIQALDSIPIDFASWPEKYKQSRREFVFSNLTEFPWTRSLYAFVGTEADEDCSMIERVVIPTDLVEVFQEATIEGRPVISNPPVELLKENKNIQKTCVSPLCVAFILLLLSLANFWLRWPAIEWLLLGLQFFIGLFLCYLVFISDLPCTGWNWLLVPFNPLPLLFWLCLRPSRLGHLQASSDGTRCSVRWHWRKVWTLSFVAILIIWIMAMCFYPHQLTDWAFVVLAAALVPVFYRY